MNLGTCSFCGRGRKVFKVRGEDNIYRCQVCYIRLRRQTLCLPCPSCQKVSSLECRSVNGESICINCFKKQNSDCTVCGKKGRFHHGRCKSCVEGNQFKTGTCVDCGAPYKFFKTSKIRCKKCREIAIGRYNNCPKCKNFRHLNIDVAGVGRVCTYCYKKYFSEHKICAECGKKSIAFFNKKHLKVLCISCSLRLRKS